MSKLRQDIDRTLVEHDLDTPLEGDMCAYVVFTQLRPGAPHVYAGWLDAVDDEMALQFALEHYGRDQKCVSIWIAPRKFVAGMRINADASAEPVPERAYQIFVQPEAGDQHESAERVTSTTARGALDNAWSGRENAESIHNLWAVPCDEIAETDAVDVIWNSTDQTYRLARGYSKDVREKWQAIRAKNDVAEYEKDDLKETF